MNKAAIPAFLQRQSRPEKVKFIGFHLHHDHRERHSHWPNEPLRQPGACRETDRAITH